LTVSVFVVNIFACWINSVSEKINNAVDVVKPPVDAHLVVFIPTAVSELTSSNFTSISGIKTTPAFVGIKMTARANLPAKPSRRYRIKFKRFADNAYWQWDCISVHDYKKGD